VTDANGTPQNGVNIEMSWRGAEPDTQFPVTNTGKDPYKPAGYYEFVHIRGLFRLKVVQGDWPSDVADDLNTATVPAARESPSLMRWISGFSPLAARHR